MVEKNTAKEEFKYIVRIADTDLDGERSTLHALTGIKGIGLRMSAVILDTAGIKRNEKIGNLSEEEIERIRKVISNLSKHIPNWMANRQKDLYTGKDRHVIGADIASTLREDINRLKKIRAYRGIRHELGLPVRGQRTRSNRRTGLTLGVSRKR